MERTGVDGGLEDAARKFREGEAGLTALELEGSVLGALSLPLARRRWIRVETHVEGKSGKFFERETRQVY